MEDLNMCVPDYYPAGVFTIPSLSAATGFGIPLGYDDLFPDAEGEDHWFEVHDRMLSGEKFSPSMNTR